MDSYLKGLRDKHSAIQAKIDAEYARPAPDALVLGAMKRIKLRLREKMRRAETPVRAAPVATLVIDGDLLADDVSASVPKRRRKRDLLFGAVGNKYRSLKGRISELLARHNGDYAELSAASQEMGFLKHALRNRIARLRAKKRAIRQVTAP